MSRNDAPEVDEMEVIDETDVGSLEDVLGEAPVAEVTAKELHRKAIMEARTKVREWLEKALQAGVEAIEGVTEFTVAELKLAIGNGRGGAGGESKSRWTAVQGILDLFTHKEGALPEVGAEIDGMVVFQAFGYGTPKMKNIIADGIKKPKDPTDRVWITCFEPAVKLGQRRTEPTIFTVAGYGADAPEGWNGYKIPVEEDI